MELYWLNDFMHGLRTPKGSFFIFQIFRMIGQISRISFEVIKDIFGIKRKMFTELRFATIMRCDLLGLKHQTLS